MSLPLFDASDPGTVRRVSLVRLTSEIARSIAVIGRVVVEGEVHRVTRGGRGSTYFTLKDRAAQISVWCPASRASRCRAVAGERVSVVGTLEWSPERGQISLRALDPAMRPMCPPGRSIRVTSSLETISNSGWVPSGGAM